MPDIGTLNRKITINKYLFGQDENGGNIKALAETFIVWANVEQRSGSRTLDNLQIQYKEVYKVVKRYEASRILSPDDEIVYETKILNIGAVIEKEEGRKKFNEITAFSNGKTLSSDTGTIYNVIKMVEYIATGGETGFQDDDLKGFEIILVFRDGIQYSYITSGLPVRKQALYDATAGTIAFPAEIGALEPEEVVDVYLLK